MSKPRRLGKPSSRKIAVTATGSVAAIRAPNTNIVTIGKPVTVAMSQPTITVVRRTPGMANTRTARRLSRNSENSMCKAASKSNGGNKISNMSSRANSGASSGFSGKRTVIATPTITRPTVYGKRTNFVNHATKAAMSNRAEIINSVVMKSVCMVTNFHKHKIEWSLTHSC